MSLLIKNFCDYRSSYDSNILRGTDNPNTPRPWCLKTLIEQKSNPEYKLLDIGCGTAHKIIPLSGYFDHIVGVEPSSSMRAAAKKNIYRAKCKNISIKDGEASSLPIEENSIDLITVMLARWDVREIQRVLKPGGSVIIESVGCRDKEKLKRFFGKDDEGWRGQFLEYEIEKFLETLNQDFSPHFDKVSIKNGYWETFYEPAGIMALLKNTPTIRNYNEQKDKHALDTALSNLTKEGKITLLQNRTMLYAEGHKHSKI